MSSTSLPDHADDCHTADTRWRRRGNNRIVDIRQFWLHRNIKPQEALSCREKTFASITTTVLALAGILDLPDTQPAAYALFAHCFTCSKNLKAANHLSRAMVTAGLAVLRFDFTGLGQSEGEFGDTTFSSNVSDLVAAARFLKRDYAAPRLLIGHSLGGTAVLQAADEIPSAVAVATIGSPATPVHVGHMFEDARAELEASGEAEVTLGGRPFRMKQRFLDDLEQHGLPEALGSLRKALLIMHAPLDDVVGIDNASDLFRHAKHPKSFLSLDKADHLLSREQDFTLCRRSARGLGAPLLARARR